MSLQEFKESFLASCKQAGLSEAEIDSCIDTALAQTQKAAEGWEALTTPLSKAWDAAKTIARPAATGAGYAYLGIPALVGAGGGAALSALRGADDMDVEDARRQETIDTYRQLAHEMELRAKSRSEVPTKARSPIVR